MRRRSKDRRRSTSRSPRPRNRRDSASGSRRARRSRHERPARWSHAPSRPGSFRATSAILPTQPGSIASARAPDPGPSRRCLRAARVSSIAGELVASGLRAPERECASDALTQSVVRAIRASERVGLSGAEPRQYCRAVSAILHWSAEDSPTPSRTPRVPNAEPLAGDGCRLREQRSALRDVPSRHVERSAPSKR